MSRKNRSQYHEPVIPVVIDTEDPIEDTIEVGEVVLVEGPINDTVDVGTVMLVDGPFEPVPLDASSSAADDFNSAVDSSTDDSSALDEFRELDGFSVPQPSAGDFGAADIEKGTVDQAHDALNQVQDNVQDKAQDMAQNITQTAQGIAGKAQDTAQDIASKAQDAAQGIAGKAQDATQVAADKAKEAAQKVAENAASVKAAAASAGSNSKSAVAGAAGSVGMGLWSVIQRSPLQAIFFIFSLVWLIRNNSATAAQTPVSVTDAAGNAAEKVGTLSGQVQVAASNLGSQVSTQAQQGAGWFSKTLQENPLVIGAMAIVAGLGLGLAVPETSYEHKTLGKTRDQLLDKATEAATDLGHKVQTVAQTAVHDAIESGKAEAKNQGLAPQDEAPQGQPQQEQPQQEQNQQQ